jgi:protein ImuB
MSLRRYRPPVLLSVQLQALRLSSFFLHGKRYVVREAYGPWRKSGEWWTDHVWSLEEWDVCATTTAKDTEPTMLCVIRHDRLRHRWYLVALYD